MLCRSLVPARSILNAASNRRDNNRILLIPKQRLNLFQGQTAGFRNEQRNPDYPTER